LHHFEIEPGLLQRLALRRLADRLEVVMALLPMLSMVVMQERVAAPSTCTVQAPHSAQPQPNFVPVMPSRSRSTQSRGVSPSTSTVWGVPLTLMVKGMAYS